MLREESTIIRHMYSLSGSTVTLSDAINTLVPALFQSQCLSLLRYLRSTGLRRCIPALTMKSEVAAMDREMHTVAVASVRLVNMSLIEGAENSVERDVVQDHSA